jgi:hypothetical protein
MRFAARVRRSDLFVAEESSARSTPGTGAPMGTVATSGGAGRYWLFPGCVAVKVTVPCTPEGVRTLPESVAGPEVRTKVTGSPLVVVNVRATGGVRVETAPGGENWIVWARSCAKRAATDLFAVMRTAAMGVVPAASPDQLTNTLPWSAVADTVAVAPGG